jgi:phosphoribosylformylglycinamidine cyclo-ligase
MAASSYRAAGVDLEAASQAKDLFKQHVRSTFGSHVLSDIGSFGSLFELQGYENPVLVASTDGVGTKIKLAFWLDRYDTIGHDVVNQSVNDILANGARPLFFLDYIAVDKLDPYTSEKIVKGIAEACRKVNCALIGGEIAQMPGVYTEGSFDLVGFIVGVTERKSLLDNSTIQIEDVLIALPSSGLHTNGYSLVRKIYQLEEDTSALDVYYQDLGRTLGESLIEPHLSYWPTLEPAIPFLKGMAHITGGGLIENIKRIIPKGMEPKINYRSWKVPPLFEIIRTRGHIEDSEMWSVFNMGVGMVLACDPSKANSLLDMIPESWKIGKIVKSVSTE